MRPDQIIRAWKDQQYWHSLSKKERSQIPENPAGALELADELLAEISGGRPPIEENTSVKGNCNSMLMSCTAAYGSGSGNYR